LLRKWAKAHLQQWRISNFFRGKTPAYSGGESRGVGGEERREERDMKVYPPPRENPIYAPER